MSRCARAVAVAAVLTLCGGSAWAETQESPLLALYRILFTGNHVSADWAFVAGRLVDYGIIRPATVRAKNREAFCTTALRALEFDASTFGCSKEIKELLTRLNPKLPETVEPGTEVVYPDLKLLDDKVSLTFDLSLASDQKRFDLLKSANDQLLLAQSSRSPDKVKTVFRQYYTDVEAPADAKTNAALSSLIRFDEKAGDYHVLVERYGQPATTGSPNGLAALMSWWQSCKRRDQVQLPKPPYVSFLGDSQNQACVRECQDNDCPEVVLIDTPVASHADLAGALRVATPQPPAADPTQPPYCPVVQFQDTFHGTHLAGIMVGHGDGSAEGLAPNAGLTSVNRTIDTIRMKRRIQELDAADRQALFVIASRLDDGGIVPSLPTPDERLHRPPIMETILASQALWIVSAGEQKDNEPRREISVSNLMPPMNAGDQKNILVVTACDRCLTSDARIASWANYSRSLVSVAAPGGSLAEGIPSTATGNSYAEAYGTSQSTAFAGGLAAGMQSCYSRTLSKPRNLKLRIEATSFPFSDSDSAAKVATGMIDARVAMLRPSLHWMRAAHKDWRAVTPSDLQWCPHEVRLLDPETREPTAERYVDINTLRRLHRVDMSGPDPIWIMYVEPEPFQSAGLERRGPALLQVSPDAKFLRARFIGEDAFETFSLKDIEDILPMGAEPPHFASEGCN